MKRKNYFSIVFFLFLQSLLFSNEFRFLKKKLAYYIKDPHSNCRYEFLHGVNYKNHGLCRIRFDSEKIEIQLWDDNFYKDFIFIYPEEGNAIKIDIKYEPYKIHKQYVVSKDHLVSTSKMFIYYYSDPDINNKKFLQIYFYSNKLVISFEFGNIYIYI